jgi:hypothetical protein
MTAKLGVRTYLHALRHYSATELLAWQWGSTTLKVYAAWVASADKKAADLIAVRLSQPRQGGVEPPR